MTKPHVQHGVTPFSDLLTMLQSGRQRLLEERITSDTLIEQLARWSTGYTPDPEHELQELSYYDYPVLKAPVWRWEIIWYFYLGGLAAGTYILTNIALLFGSQEDRTSIRIGYYAALITLLPCPPLLIKDLGRPERFLNMLRIFKIKSPMSMGVWALLLFSLLSGASATIQATRDGLLGSWRWITWIGRMPLKLLALPGIAVAAFLGSYTGVLLATTSIPLWSRSKLLGSTFIASALSTGTALISCLLRIRGASARTLHKLEQIEWVCMSVEILSLLAFLRGSGRAARPLVGNGPAEKGKTFWSLMFSGGLLLPWLLQTLLLWPRKKPQSNRQKRGGAGLIVSLLVLCGGYVLRHTIIHAGHISSADARTTLWHAKNS